jgi:hypothetical protein
MAYSADKGEKLLEVQTGLRGGMGPPITFMLDGKQYVALAGGTGQVPPPPGGGAVAGGAGARGVEPLPPDLAGAAAQGAPRGEAPAAAPAPAPNAPPAGPPVPPKLLVFVLDGKGSLPVGN